MDRRKLQGESEELLNKMQQVPPREPGEQLRTADEIKILALRDQGFTQQRIAEELGCSQSTVSRTLAEYEDTRVLARKHLEAQSLPMAQRFAADARPGEIARMLGKLDVVRDDDAPGARDDAPTIFLGVGVQMTTVASDGTPVADPFEAGDVIDIDPLGSVVVVDANGSPMPGTSQTPRLGVVRRGGSNTARMFALPCDVSEIPPNVKITPAAAALLRSGERGDS